MEIHQPILDGVPHQAGEQSTSFQPYRPKLEAVPESLCSVYDECVLYYRELFQHRLN